jgi:hypothetical protein
MHEMQPDATSPGAHNPMLDSQEQIQYILLSSSTESEGIICYS